MIQGSFPTYDQTAYYPFGTIPHYAVQATPLSATVQMGPSVPDCIMQAANIVVSMTQKKRRKICIWTPAQKDFLVERIILYLIELNLDESNQSIKNSREQFYKKRAVELNRSSSSCKNMLARWHKNEKDNELCSKCTAKQIKQLVEIVFKAPSFENGYDIAGKDLGMTPDDCKCIFQLTIIKILFKPKMHSDFFPLLNSNSCLSSPTNMNSPPARLPKEPKYRAYHNWTAADKEEVQSSIQKYKRLKVKKVFERVTEEFNSKHNTNLSCSGIKRIDRETKFGLSKDDAGRMDWTEEAIKILFDELVDYLFAENKPLKSEFLARVAATLGTDGMACSNKLCPRQWFTKTEQKILQEKWSVQKNESLVEVIRAEPTREKGRLAAAKKFKKNEWECWIRFQDTCIRKFREIHVRRPKVRETTLDDQKYNSTQPKKRKTSEPIHIPKSKLIKVEDATAAESLLGMGKQTLV